LLACCQTFFLPSTVAAAGYPSSCTGYRYPCKKKRLSLVTEQLQPFPDGKGEGSSLVLLCPNTIQCLQYLHRIGNKVAKEHARSKQQQGIAAGSTSAFFLALHLPQRLTLTGAHRRWPGCVLVELPLLGRFPCSRLRLSHQLSQLLHQLCNLMHHILILGLTKLYPNHHFVVTQEMMAMQEAPPQKSWSQYCASAGTPRSAKCTLHRPVLRSKLALL